MCPSGHSLQQNYDYHQHHCNREQVINEAFQSCLISEQHPCSDKVIDKQLTSQCLDSLCGHDIWMSDHVIDTNDHAILMTKHSVLITSLLLT